MADHALEWNRQQKRVVLKQAGLSVLTNRL